MEIGNKVDHLVWRPVQSSRGSTQWCILNLSCTWTVSSISRSWSLLPPRNTFFTWPPEHPAFWVSSRLPDHSCQWGSLTLEISKRRHWMQELMTGVLGRLGEQARERPSCSKIVSCRSHYPQILLCVLSCISRNPGARFFLPLRPHTAAVATTNSAPAFCCSRKQNCEESSFSFFRWSPLVYPVAESYWDRW